jgi:diamine N-acetyltransferase
VTQNSEQPIFNIGGELVALGPLRRELLPIYHRWYNDFAVRRSFGGVPNLRTLEQQAGWYDHTTSESSGVTFTMYELSTKRPIGTTYLAYIDYQDRCADFGILIGESDCRGRGYGTEAARLTLDFAFTALGLYSVGLRTNEYNLAGLRAFEKAGFREYGRRWQCRMMGGRLWDEVLMDCLATEFESPVLERIFAPDEPK